MQSHEQDLSGALSIRYAVIVLAGGRARRLPGKLARLGADGRSLLATCVAGALAVQPLAPTRVVIVGPTPPDITDEAYADPRVSFIRDEIPFEGPARAVASVIDRIDEPVVILLAADAPHGAAAIPGLLTAITSDSGLEAAVLVTDRRQHLCTAYVTSALRQTSHEAARASDLSRGLHVVEVPDVWDAGRDIDTAEDAHALGFDRSDGA